MYSLQISALLLVLLCTHKSSLFYFESMRPAGLNLKDKNIFIFYNYIRWRFIVELTLGILLIYNIQHA